MTIKSNLGVYLAQYRQSTGKRVTYKDIEDTVGISQNTLSRFANDQITRVDYRTLDALCRFFDCTPGDLLIYVPDESDEVSARADTKKVGQ